VVAPSALDAAFMPPRDSPDITSADADWASHWLALICDYPTLIFQRAIAGLWNGVSIEMMTT